MKSQLFLLKNFLRLLVPAVGFAIAIPGVFCADVFGPPSTIDYQGRLLDGSGTPLAPDTPANYEIQFRIYDEQTGGNIVWAEKQLATVSNGLFSVRLGEGDAILGEGAVEEGSVGHASPGLLGAFDGKERYLGVTVVIPGQTPSEVTPRLAFLASPFSYVAARAQSADRVVQTASSQPSALSVGSVSYVPLILSATSTLGGDNANVLADATAGAVAASLPAGTAGEKKEITVTKTDASANPVTVVPPGGGTINGSATPISLAKRGDSVTLRNTDANNWIVVSRYTGEGTVLADSPIAGGLLARGGVPGLNGVNKNGYAFSGNGGDNDSGLFSTGAGRIGLYSNNREVLSVDPNGYVVTPDFFTAGRVTSAGGVLARPGNWQNAAGGYTFSGDEDTGWWDWTSNGGMLWACNGTITMTMTAAGTVVGQSTGSDQKGKLSVYGSGNGNGNFFNFAFYAYNGNVNTGLSFGNPPIGIYSDNRVVAVEFNATSDARIKNIKGVSEGRSDLAKLMDLQVTDYTFRDALKNGTGEQKKLIAQQVEQVYPAAVTKMTDVLPDIMKKASLKDGWIMLATDLKKGDKVRLLAEKDQDKLCEVTEVAKGKFRVAFETTEKEVFVYGREVNDFRTVDYDAIAMLNVSATQQVKKDSDAAETALRAENESLRARLATLEGEKVATEKRLVALEAALLGKGGSRASATNDASTTIPVTSK